MGLLQGFVEGALASIAAGCSTHPLDLIKVRLQLQGEVPLASPSTSLHPVFALAATTPPHCSPPVSPCGPLSIASRIIHTEGPLALFSGISATILRQILYSSTRLGLYQSLTNHGSSQEHKPLSPLQKIAAGLVSGAVGAAVGNPADVALVRMQADGRLPFHLRRNYRGVWFALTDIVHHEGVHSLWKGSSMTVQRAMVVTAAQLATYDQVKEELIHHIRMTDGVVLHLMASCVAGFVASIASNPLDVVKTRIMSMRTDQPIYGGAFDCAIKTLKREGFRAFYKGFVPTVMRQGPYTVVLFVTLEQIRKLFRNW